MKKILAMAVLMTAALAITACGGKKEEESAQVQMQEVQESAAEAEFRLSDTGKAFLEEMCQYMPEFSDSSALDEGFWRDFLFLSYTGRGSDETELVKVWREDLGMEEQEARVSESDAAAYVELALGVSLPDIKPAFEDMEEGQTAFYYEDGFYYIGASDFPDFEYNYQSCTEEENGCYLVEIAVTFEGDPDSGSIFFTVKPADNENGFVIVKKENKLNLKLA